MPTAPSSILPGATARAKATVCLASYWRAIPTSGCSLRRRFRPRTSSGRRCHHTRTTKCFLPQHVFKYADAIRTNLGTDSIDLLQFHVWQDAWTDEPDFGNTVEKLKRDGVIRAFGLSLNRWEPENGIRAVRSGLVDAVQVIYNIFDQAPEDELFPLCREMDIGVIARVPLDEGSLGGNMTLDTRFPEGDWRARYFTPENLVPTIARVEGLKQVLPPGMTLPEMAIRFVLSNPTVNTTIVGMRRREHVEANVSYSDKGPLDTGLIAELRRHRWDRKPAPWSD